VDAHLPWEAPPFALLLAEAEPAPELRESLKGFDLGAAYTGSAPLLRSLANLLPELVSQSPIFEGGPISDWYLKLVAPFGPAPGAVPPPLEATPEEAKWAESFCAALPQRFLSIHPGSGSARKNWPAERFSEIVARLSGDRPWLLVEGEADGAAVAPLRRVPGALLARNLSLRLLGAVLARAGLHVGNDSGVTHLAAAYNTPTLGLFGPTDPVVWAPVGQRVKVLRPPSGVLTELGVEEVEGAARGLAR
jgi:ADP-heptose:LPS heptosyltransferase